ncbi:MAG: GDP-L-fucose synthase [Candidatus Margulisiibacteriota bacterium]|jgi:GDP-L-fucose synthase
MLELKNKKILLTGGNGFLGKFVQQELINQCANKNNIIIPDSKKDDLKILSNCQRLVKNIDIVIHLAAKVGGIGFNQNFPGVLFYDNLIMGVQLMEAAKNAKVEKFVAIGTICAYPKYTPTPFKEDDLWSGYPEETNAPYGLAKKILLVQAQAYRQQYGFNAIYLLPVNLYGPGDNFKPESSHVIPALIRKIAEAKKQNSPYIEVWGSGQATREFIYVTDAAKAIVMATQNYDKSAPVNIGTGQDISIKALVKKICELMDYQGEIKWNTTKPDGQPKRLLDTTKSQKEFGFTAQTDFTTGLKNTIDWYLTNRL